MTNVELIVQLMKQLDSLSLRGVRDWEIAVQMASELLSLKHGLEHEAEQKKAEEAARLEELRKQREALKQAAAERGEELLGGEIYHITADGVEEVAP